MSADDDDQAPREPQIIQQQGLAPTPLERAYRWQLIRDALVFQCKLLVDGIMDILLGPVSLIAAAIELLRGTRGDESLFYEVIKTGARFDRWINLFGSARDGEAELKGGNIDGYIAKVEAAIRAKHSQGGLTRTTQETVDRIIDSLRDESPRGDSQRKPAGDSKH